jgi:hypothetical protein
MKTIKLKEVNIVEVIIKPDDHMVIMYDLITEEGEALFRKQVVLKNADFPQIDKLERLVEQLVANLKVNEGV